MPSHPVINQLDPFGENEDEFQTKGIRHSRSRVFGNFFVNLINPEDEEKRKRNRIALFSGIAVVVIAVLAIIFIPKLSTPEPTPEPEPVVNPTGRESASKENIPSLDDPEARAYEQEKLDTVLALITQDDWEYTNALFETIFPDYLDDCGKYDYYRAAIALSKNFESFSIPYDVATERAEKLYKNCDRAATETTEITETTEEDKQ